MEKLKNYAITYEQGVIGMSQKLIDRGIADKVRLMPDTHIGKGSAIGFTAPLTDKVIPNVVGVDIGCGMTVWKLGTELPKSLKEIDEIISQKIPSGFDPKGNTDKHNSREEVMRFDDFTKLYIDTLTPELLSSFKADRGQWFLRQLGSLGSGNHFIEINIDTEGMHYLVIHSGSRGLGVKVNDYWQKIAIKEEEERKNVDKDIKELIDALRELNPRIPEKNLVKMAEKELNKKVVLTHEEKLEAYLTGENKENYLKDMRVAQKYAVANRQFMGEIILKALMKVDEYKPWFVSTHNFIAEDNIIRKGATSAYEGELAIIPINMKDGSIIIEGKGNKDWNFSAPHGAGRLMSRKVAKQNISLEDFKNSMKDVYSSTVCENTIDEAPMAYKDMREIIKAIEPTAKIVKFIKPIYNFKGMDK